MLSLCWFYHYYYYYFYFMCLQSTNSWMLDRIHEPFETVCVANPVGFVA